MSQTSLERPRASIMNVSWSGKGVACPLSANQPNAQGWILPSPSLTALPLTHSRTAGPGIQEGTRDNPTRPSPYLPLDARTPSNPCQESNHTTMTTQKPRPQIHPDRKQQVAQSAQHLFRVSRTGTAWCTCGGWTLWEASLESARRSHKYHMENTQHGPDGLLAELPQRGTRRGQ